MSGVCIAVCAQAISGTKNLEKELAAIANADGVEGFRFDIKDVRSTTDVLLTVACLIFLAAFSTTAFLISDWMFTSSSSQSAVPRQRISTKTLKLQAALFSFLLLWLLAVLIPSTAFVRTHHAKVFDGSDNATVLPANLSSVDTRYWDYGFLRCLGAAPWFILIASLPLAFVTICAAHLLPVSSQNETLATKEKSLE